MKKTILKTAVLLAMAVGGTPVWGQTFSSSDFKDAVRLYEGGMYEQSKHLFDEMASAAPDALNEGYSLLCDLQRNKPGAAAGVSAYDSKYAKSELYAPIHFLYARILFDETDYATAYDEYSKVKAKSLSAKDAAEYLFKKTYCKFGMGQYEEARDGFLKSEKSRYSDYAYASKFALGYIDYVKNDFSSAFDWFGKSLTDARFAEPANYYMLECRFMQNDYDYVIKNGEKIYKDCPQERRPHLARILSESYLVRGDTYNASRYYDENVRNTLGDTRADLFYAGSLQYALGNYSEAAVKYSRMPERTDSLGQIANYQLGYSYVQLKNKVSAMGAFKDAADATFNDTLREDAFFNYAKLAFDLNHDPSAFRRYLEAFPKTARKDQIYNYIAVASLQNQDYAAAVEAYDSIDELNAEMRSNYMKANYLRARQLISSGAYRDAIPCLKAATFFTPRSDNFNKLTRFWLADAYYKTERYDDAISTYTDLYNNSALDYMKEGKSIPYNLAYTYFKSGNYAAASTWFSKYIASSDRNFRKDAMVRKADCDFARKDYKSAASAYQGILYEYKDNDDVYPYYQLGLSYGLLGDNSSKITALCNVRGAQPDAAFYSDALYELGRAYVTAGNDKEAMSCFETLRASSKDSTFAAKALLELGSLSRNLSQRDNALSYFKQVVENYGSTGYRDDALAAIESLYQASGEPDKYLAYIENLDNPVRKSDTEKELLYFSTAEQLYLAGSYEKAVAALQTYMEAYPKGEKLPHAYFYLADSYKVLGNKEKACDYFAKVTSFGSASPFEEISWLNLGNLSYGLEKYSDAYSAFSSLLGSAQLEDNRYVAKNGMMNSAFKARKFQDAIEAAAKVKLDSKCDEAAARAADYVRAKSYLALSERARAFEILTELSAKPASDEGAEAAFMIIQDIYDRGEFDSVEAKVYKFADAAPNQSYWLAKSFIVLGDSFAEKENFKQAKATFDSIRDGYKPASGESDDVTEAVKMRLDKLNEIMK